MKKVWFVYILECSDGTLYTGITNDLDKRIDAHNAGKGAKYTKGRGPVKLKFCTMRRNKSEATKLEILFKKDSRKQKLEYIDEWTKERMTLQTAISILREEGWKTEWEVAKNSDPDNDSTYVIWTKEDLKVYLGNFFVEISTCGIGFPWAEKNGSGKVKTKKEFVAFLNGDTLTAFNKR